MKIGNFKSFYIRGMVILLIVIIACISYVYIITKNSNPFDCIRDMRDNMVDIYEPLNIEKTKNGTMVYSVGKVNSGVDNMYFVDIVKKSSSGYKWVGGGGHINHDRDNRDFVFSAQLLNENQNINPTLFGVLSDVKIKNLTVTIKDNELYEAIIYDGKIENEKFYYVPLADKVCNCKYFKLSIIYENDKRNEYIISGDDKISELQKGKQVYFN